MILTTNPNDHSESALSHYRVIATQTNRISLVALLESLHCILLSQPIHFGIKSDQTH